MLRKSRFWRLLVLPAGRAVLGGGQIARAGSTAAVPFPAPAGAGCWTIVPSGHSVDREALYGVAALADNDVWAVGEHDSHGYHALVKHWDGQQWTAGPLLAHNPSALDGVAAAAPNDVGAVGTVPDGGNPFVLQPLIVHWDGSGWMVQPLAPFGGPTILYGLSIRAPDDIWAVGDIIFHWDGLAWAVVPRPPGGALRAVTALAAANAWAVSDGGLILHWDGTAWSSVPSPPGAGDLTGIVGLAANDLW